MEKLKKCEHCGDEFYYERITARYCSDACKQQAYVERRSNQYFRTLDADDAVIEPIPEQPMNEIEAIVPFEEIITEPEVINEAESSEAPKPNKIDSSYIRKEPGKTFVNSSTPKSQVKSNENSSSGVILALLGAAAVGFLIGGVVAASKISGDNESKEGAKVDGGDASEKFNDEIQKPIETTEEISGIPQNQKYSTLHKFHSSIQALDLFPKIGNLLAKITKLYNRLLEIMNFHKFTKPVIDKLADLKQEHSDINQSQAVDSPAETVKIEKPLDSLTKTKRADPKVIDQLLQILQSLENAKKEKEIHDRNTAKTDVTREGYILTPSPESFYRNQKDKKHTE